MIKKQTKFIGLIAAFLIFNSSLLINSAHAATLGLSPGGAEWTAGCTNTLSIVIDTEGVNSLATDAFLNYNPNEIEIVDQNSGVEGIQLGVGSAYESYPGNIVDNGIIRLTGFNRAGYFNGRGVLGTIKVRGKPGVEASTIGFQFSPGSSVDSNIANEDSNDVLSAVSNSTIRFKAGKCPTQTAPVKKPPEPIEQEQINEELVKCQTQLQVLEDYYKNDHEKVEEILCQGVEVKPAAPPSVNKEFLLFLLTLLALSLLLNIDMLIRPKNHIITALPLIGKKRKTKAKFKNHRVKKS